VLSQSSSPSPMRAKRTFARSVRGSRAACVLTDISAPMYTATLSSIPYQRYRAATLIVVKDKTFFRTPIAVQQR
jgi:hypothetical protein